MAAISINESQTSLTLTSAYQQDTYVVCDYIRTVADDLSLQTERVELHLVIPSSNIDTDTTVDINPAAHYSISNARVVSESLLLYDPEFILCHLQPRLLAPSQFYVKIPVVSRLLSTNSLPSDYILTTPRVAVLQASSSGAFKCLACNGIYCTYDDLITHCLPRSFFQRWKAQHMLEDRSAAVMM